MIFAVSGNFFTKHYHVCLMSYEFGKSIRQRIRENRTNDPKQNEYIMIRFALQDNRRSLYVRLNPQQILKLQVCHLNTMIYNVPHT